MTDEKKTITIPRYHNIKRRKQEKPMSGKKSFTHKDRADCKVVISPGVEPDLDAWLLVVTGFGAATAELDREALRRLKDWATEQLDETPPAP